MNDQREPASGAGTPPLSAPETARLQALLTRYFLRHWRQEADIDDLVQETLLRLVRSPVQADNAEAYAVRIASNLLRDRARRDQSHRADQHTAFDDTLAYLPSEEPDCDRVYEGRKQLDQLLAALTELPQRTCQVFLLQRYEGMTYTAIAKQLQISVSAVEKHMMRALLHLQARLAEQ